MTCVRSLPLAGRVAATRDRRSHNIIMKPRMKYSIVVLVAIFAITTALPRPKRQAELNEDLSFEPVEKHGIQSMPQKNSYRFMRKTSSKEAIMPQESRTTSRQRSTPHHNSKRSLTIATTSTKYHRSSPDTAEGYLQQNRHRRQSSKAQTPSLQQTTERRTQRQIRSPITEEEYSQAVTQKQSKAHQRQVRSKVAIQPPNTHSLIPKKTHRQRRSLISEQSISLSPQQLPVHTISEGTQNLKEEQQALVRLPRQAVPTTADGIPIFDRNKVSLDFPGNLYGPSVSLLIRSTKIIGDVVQNTAERYRTFLALFKPILPTGNFAIKGLEPRTTTTTTTTTSTTTTPSATPTTTTPIAAPATPEAADETTPSSVLNEISKQK